MPTSLPQICCAVPTSTADAFFPLTCTPQIPPEIFVFPKTLTEALFEILEGSCNATTPSPVKPSVISTLLTTTNELPKPHFASKVSASTPVPPIRFSEPRRSLTGLSQFAPRNPIVQLFSPSTTL